MNLHWSAIACTSTASEQSALVSIPLVQLETGRFHLPLKGDAAPRSHMRNTCSRAIAYAKSIAHLLQGFASHRALTGREPDAVVFSSFLWDMQRWGRYFPDKLQERGLSAETIEEWAANLEAVLVSIKVHNPSTQPRACTECTVPRTWSQFQLSMQCPLSCMLHFAWTDSKR